MRIKLLIALFKDGFFDLFKNLYFGFFYGHTHLDKNQIQKIRMLVGSSSDEVNSKYESLFASLIGDGEAISYASARMGVFELLKVLNIKSGDEVVLLGSTCSVMVTAIMRRGATPIFSDIDPETMGSCPIKIATCITSRTRMIVAQHSFGIPCDILPIVNLAKSANIFLLEDCALTLGSKVNGIVVGNFGDAAIFSTDHSKPISTLIGGLIYTKNKKLADLLRQDQKKLPDFPLAKQKAIFYRLILEAKYCSPKKYKYMVLIDLYVAIVRKLFKRPSPFLLEDSIPGVHSAYPYPAKLPTFLAFLGMIEIERWEITAHHRVSFMKDLFNFFKTNRKKIHLPDAYSNASLEIVPLRFVFFDTNYISFLERIKNFIPVCWIWFRSPIIATSEPLENLGYQLGECPISEHVGSMIINLPCNMPVEYQEHFKNILFSKI